MPIPQSPFHLATTLAATVLALLSAGCGRRENAVIEGNRTQTLHIGTGGEPSELDPHLINSPPDFRIIHAFFEGLTRSDPVTLEVKPGVAERWQISPDGRTYTFHLRTNARWSNGDPVTADDFLASCRRALSPALGSQYTVLMTAVRGAEDFSAGRLKDFAAVGFAAPDPRTFVITLARPTPYFLALLTGNPIWYPIHRATVEKHGRLDERGTGWTRPERFVGNGPFVLKEWRPNQHIVAAKSATYWDAARVRLNAVHFHAIDNVDAEERAFRSGQLHITRSTPITRVAAYRAESPSPLVLSPLLVVRFINVNTARPALRDPRVRRALALTIDRRRISERVLSGTEGPGFAIVPAGMPGYRSATPVPEDAGAARELLAAAGYPGGRGFPKLTLARESRSVLEMAEAIQETWRTQLGIEVTLQESESRTHWSNLQVKEYDLAIGGWVADYPDASSILDLFTSGGGWNFTGWADPAYDALLAAAAGELDPARRLETLQRAESRLLEAAPVIPLTFGYDRTLVHPSVRDWHANVLDRADYITPWLAP